MLTLYSETAVETKTVTNASRLDFQIPRKNGSYINSKQFGRSRASSDFAEDEAAFADQHLATSSAIYFRETKHYPRTFHWRLLQQRRVLEIQPADISRSDKDQKEAHLTFSFKFQDPILPLGITFTDSPNADELHIFVCTDRNEIFNIRLPTKSFCSANNISQNVSDWCRPIDVSSLTIDTVYNLYASSPYELFVAFTGGRIQALRRKPDSENWTQDYYDESSWGSTLRGIVSRRGQQYIEYGSTRLAANTVQGMVASPDTNFLYTICLNHTLRVWHLPSGRLAETKDLLNITRDPNDRIQLSPSEPGLVRLVRHPKGRHPMLVTYTPHEGGQFKFWNIKGGLTDPLVIEDRYPKLSLSPPDPDPTGNTVWSLIGFEITPGSELKPSQLWVLWRNNNYHQVYTLHFDFPTLGDAWESQWVKSASSTDRLRGPEFVLTDPQDVTSKWLDFLFYPGRYSSAVLETALARYQSLTSSKTSQLPLNKSLQERMSSTIASSVSLRRYEDAEMDYDRFATDTDHQWRNYWRIIDNLNDGRYAPLSLCFDVFSDVAWIPMANYCTAIRECSKLELLRQNANTGLEELDDIASERWPHRKAFNDAELYSKLVNLIHAAERFRKSFTPELANELWTAIEEELYTQSETPTSDRIVLIFNQVGFSDGLSEGAEDQLLRDLQLSGGVDGVSNDMFTAILDLLSTAAKRPKSNLRYTMFGSSLLSAALLDDISLTKQILTDLLVLTIFIDETDNFDPARLFEQITSSLKGQLQSLWLATHSRVVPLEFLGVSSKSSRHDSGELSQQNSRKVSILEDIFTKSIRPQPAVDRPLMYLLTDSIAESQKWMTGKDLVAPEEAAVHIQCDLIAHNDIGLATEFLRFQPSTPWSTYVKGRLRLARHEYREAATYFRKAAYTLACGKALGDLRDISAGLLTILDAEHFNSGLPRYYQHVMSLFESKQAFAQVAEFAHLSLGALASDQPEPIPNFRVEILSRIFTAETKCARYDAAFEALVELSDKVLQASSTTILVNSILDPKTSLSGTSGAVKILQKLPWSLYPKLSQHVDQHILSLAKKQSSLPALGSTSGNVDFLGVLHALRVSKKDYRGASAVLFDQLRLVQKSGRARSDPQAKAIRHSLLALINALKCVAPDEAYILANIDDDPRNQGMKRHRESSTADQPRKRKRIIITLDDLRREYQQVLDRCSRIERGDFDFDAADEEDEEDIDETQVNGSRINGDAMEL